MGQQMYPIYGPEHDACGIGAVVSIQGIKTYETVDNALKIVEKLEHRAGKDASGETGDGVGLMLQVPHKLMVKAAAAEGIALGGERDYGVGMFFLPAGRLERAQSKKMLEIIVAKEGMEFLGWRDVPIHPEILGQKARDCMPYICQCFVKRPEDCEKGLDFDRKLYLARRVFERSAPGAYVASFSSRTIVYKGMFLVGQLRQFYADLTDPDCESALALVHSRFSTNTTPNWERAHPNRYILHNGEINTIRGNVDRMLAREETMESAVLSPGDMDKLLPVVDQSGSDSAMLDNVLEFLLMNGVDLPQAVMMCIPEPWANDRRMNRKKRDFYHYYATMMEPWDGPAAIVFSDGDQVGAVLDRNGLRPCRWYVTDDDYLILSSEVGVLDLDPARIVKKSRLRPGRMLLADTAAGRLVEDRDIKESYASRQPYGEWLDANLVYLKDLTAPNKRVEKYSQELRDRLYKAFGYTYEEVKDSLLPMARTGAEPAAAMGADIPLAALDQVHQPLFNYFRQLFAQVTNPPIDAIREEIVTDTTVYVGAGGNLLREMAANCRLLQLPSPILTSVELMKIRYMDRPHFKVETLSLLYYKGSPLENAVEQLFIAADRAYRKGANILILSDRGVDENHMAIPSLLAVSALQKHLVRTKKRTAVSLILESGEPRDVHHFAALLGYGATAINPYLAQDCMEELVSIGLLDKDPVVAVEDYNSAVLHGVVKIASKMGVSTIQSYQSAQIFECVGICQNVIDRYFTNTVSRVGGIGLEEIGAGVVYNHDQAFDPLDLGRDATLDSTGTHKLRSGAGAEDHMWSPQAILLLQKAAREGSYEIFKEYSALVDFPDKPHTLRGLLDFRFAPDGGIPIDQVEPVESIVKRFGVGAMSYGAISQEAHECLAIAMNRIGSKFNCGEGGEDPERFGTEKNSSIKQVASGRFGVTSAYLNSGDEIQIKMAQGAKPGEGGRLPGKKIYPWVAKAGAQVVHICGADGGTGSAPRNSIYGAGLPWELGVAEAHRALVDNGLRRQIAIEADSKLMTGRDVAIACMLGAERFSFATAPLVTLGCCMMRACNLDTCPAGIAGERFCVRNSGAVAVVEGVGDHGCEYMTGGRVVILGKTGRNFAAGMSGGVAYVLDEDHDLYLRLNKDQVIIDGLTESQDIQELRALIEEHVAATGSEKGREILAAFKSYIPCFKKIMPGDYLRMIQAIAQRESRGMSREQAEIEAFYANTKQ